MTWSIWISFGTKEKCNNGLIDLNLFWKKVKIQQWLDRYESAYKKKKWLDQYECSLEERKNTTMTWSIWISFGTKEKFNNDLIDMNMLWKNSKIQEWPNRSESTLEEKKNATLNWLI